MSVIVKKTCNISMQKSVESISENWLLLRCRYAAFMVQVSDLQFYILVVTNSLKDFLLPFCLLPQAIIISILHLFNYILFCCFVFFIGRALRQRQCTLEGQDLYVNVWGSVHWETV